MAMRYAQLRRRQPDGDQHLPILLARWPVHCDRLKPKSWMVGPKTWMAGAGLDAERGCSGVVAEVVGDGG